jgi:hypothetical protein
MKTQKTYSEIINFNNAAATYSAKNPEDNRICVSIKNVQKQFQKIQNDFAEMIDDARLDCCATDANGIILRDGEGKYQFTIEGTKKLKPLLKKINETKFEINARIPENIKPLIAKLTDDEKTTFAGFVLPEIIHKAE